MRIISSPKKYPGVRHTELRDFGLKSFGQELRDELDRWIMVACFIAQAENPLASVMIFRTPITAQ
jgi:hypothetical protein